MFLIFNSTLRKLQILLALLCNSLFFLKKKKKSLRLEKHAWFSTDESKPLASTKSPSLRLISSCIYYNLSLKWNWSKGTFDKFGLLRENKVWSYYPASLLYQIQLEHHGFLLFISFSTGHRCFITTSIFV